MDNVMHTLPHLNIVEENDLYVVGWVKTMEEVKEVLSSFMGKTNLDYRMYRKTKNFGYREMPVASATVRFSNTVKGESEDDPEKSKLPVVPFQGFGFVILPGESYMGCKFGSDYSFTKNAKRRAERQALNPQLKQRKQRTSIKLGCPAQIMVKETFCFVDYQCEYDKYHVKKLQSILREKLLAGEGLNVEKRLYMRLPKSGVHKFHEIPDVTDTESRADVSRLLGAIKAEAGDDDQDMDVPEPGEDEFEESASIQSVPRAVEPTWAELFDERYTDLYGWVGTAEKAEQLLREYERATDTHYVPHKYSKQLGLSEVVSLEDQNVIWEDGGFTTCTGDGELKIPFEGFPMILLNIKNYRCEQGKYKKVKGVAHHGCWMYVKMKEVIVFPEYALPEHTAYNVLERMKMQNCLTADVKEGKPVEAQRRIYMALIPPDDHNHNVTMGRMNDVTPDQQLCDRMRDLFQLGINSSDLITRHLHNMTRNEIYKDKKAPSPDNKKFFPTEAKVMDYTELHRKNVYKYDGVSFKNRVREREGLVSACRGLLDECQKMLHFLLGKTALDDVMEKLEALHNTMKLYAPDMTHPEVEEVLPYITQGVEPPTAHQRALAACGKTKSGFSPPKKKRRKRGAGDVYSEQNVSDLASLFSNEDSDSETSNLGATYPDIMDTQQTEEAELTAAAQSLVEINQPFHYTSTTTQQPVYQTITQPAAQHTPTTTTSSTTSTIPEPGTSAQPQYAALTPVPKTQTIIRTSTPKSAKLPVIKVVKNQPSSSGKVGVGPATTYLQLVPGGPINVNVQKVVTVASEDASPPPPHVEAGGGDLSVGLNIEAQSDDQIVEEGAIT